MAFTLKQLEYFVAAAEMSSIKLASERINISQPSISSAIAHLEREFELQLFVRHHAQGLALTSSGKRMMRDTKLLLRQTEELHVTAGALRNEIGGRISVGCMVTLAPMIAPKLGLEFMQKFPAVNFQMMEGSHEELLFLLRQVEIDAAISYNLDFPEDVEFEPLANLPPRILVSTHHQLAKRKAVSLKELQGEPMILLDLPYSRQYFLSIFQNEGLTANIVAHAKNQEVVRSMVANGFGFTLTNVRPVNQGTLDGQGLVAVPLEGRHKPMKIGVATLQQDHKPKILEVFEDHCRSMISDTSIPGMLPL